MENCTKRKSWKIAKQKSLKTHKKLKEERIKKYYKNPKKCPHCSKVIEYCRDLKRKTFCNRSCSASFNNVGKCRNKSKRTIFNCLHCGNQLSGNQKKYCSNKCSGMYKSEKVINEWLENPKSIKVLYTSYREYMLKEAKYKCVKCGWGEKNIYSNTYPLIVDHIDGNSENNNPKNLQVICSNCDSLLSTYKALNKGNGRHSRRKRYKEGKSY